jgi:AcrR family transcriptional regulator
LIAVPRPKQRTPELAERVLQASLHLLANEGAGALTARRLAEEAATSPAAIYELFGDKVGVLRAMFFSGFERLAEELGQPDTDPDDPIGALLELALRYRTFVVTHPALTAVMFSRPFASFDPTPEEQAAGAAVRGRIVTAVQAAIHAKRLRGDATDISHAFVALIHGLAAAESSHRLGRSDAAVARRWDVAVDALLTGFAHETNAP